MSIFWQIFSWTFGVITCGFYSLVLMVHSRHYLVFSPLLFIALANAYCLTVVKKSPSMSAESLRLLFSANKFAWMVATILFIFLSPLCLLATFGLFFWVMQIPSAMWQSTTSESFPGYFELLFFIIYYLWVALGPIMTAGSLNIKLTSLNPRVSTLGAVSFPTLFALLLSIVLLGIFPSFLTEACLDSANRNPKTLPESLLLLRATSNEPTFISSCYQDADAFLGFFLLAPSLHGYPPSSDFCRELYYRVYGRSFNTARHPAWQSIISFDVKEIANLLIEDAAQFTDFDWQYDRDFTSDYVGGRVQGLDLESSKIQGTVNLNECTANLDWKMRIANKFMSDKELRTQILLPPHAVVSGCSLIIDGIKHPAVFATRASSRKAYVESAQSGNTPLLISTAGAGRVLLQTATGYSYKKPIELSLQITAPLTLLDPQNVALALPLITEKNFSIKCKHEVQLKAADGAVQKIDFQNEDSFDGKTALFWKRDDSKATFVAADPGVAGGKIVETLVSKIASSSKPLIFVVDGSAKMAGSIEKIADQLAGLKAKRATIVWASDTPIVVVQDVSSDSQAWKSAVARLRDSACVGGQDNASALTLALTTAGLKSDSDVIWLHAPQPVAFSGGKLLPLLKSFKHSLNLYEYQLLPGPNEVIKSLDQSPALHQVPNLEGPEKDLARLFAILSGQKPDLSMVRQAVSEAPAGALTSASGQSLQQLYYSDKILTDKKDPVSTRKLGAIAEKLHIVTPVTSAIVLAWKQEDRNIKVEHYDSSAKNLVKGFTHIGGAKASDSQLSSAAGSSAPDPSGGGSVEEAVESQTGDSSIPVKPEPPLAVTIACAILMMAGVLWIKRKRNQTVLTN